MSLRPAEWKCFVIVSRDIQRGENGGLISERDVAARTSLALRHVQAALKSLVEERGLLGRKPKSGSTTEYFLPFRFRGGDRIPTGIQLEPVKCIPRGKQSTENCIPTGEQNCIPTGEQHLNYLESSENTHQNSGGLKQEGPVVRVETPPFESAIGKAAAEIHDRHPAVRRCGPGEVQKLLRAIAGRVRSPDRLKLLDTINENHRQWCASHQWTKDGGEFSKGLDNWLAPTKERYLTRPGKASPAMLPAPEYQSAEDYLRRMENE
jgi:hypothetical protein